MFFMRMMILGLFSLTAFNLIVWQGIEMVQAVSSLFGNQDS